MYKTIGIKKTVTHMMLLLITAAFLMTSVYGCASRAGTGAVVGSLAGAAIGGNFGPDGTERTRNALIGAGIGAGIGYMAGNEADKAAQYPYYYY